MPMPYRAHPYRARSTTWHDHSQLVADTPAESPMQSMPSSRQHDRARQQIAAGGAAQQLRDEYNADFEDDGGETFVLDKFQLESGRLMHRVPIRFKSWGTLNGTRDNVLVVCHALTGNGTFLPRRVTCAELEAVLARLQPARPYNSPAL